MPTFLPNIFGAYDTRDNLAMAIADFTESRAAADIQAFSTEFNALVGSVTAALAVSDTIAQTDFGTIGGGEDQRPTREEERDPHRQHGEGDERSGGRQRSV